jgi:DNA invertase Pin-like site-specific DNA recombinase
MERTRRKGWDLIALDLGVDTSTPAGTLMANVVATVAEYERALIAQRTREGMAVKRQQGVRFGRTSTLHTSTLRRIRRSEPRATPTPSSLPS